MITAPAHLPFDVNLKVDSHIHTSLCNHATGSMEEYVLAAIANDLETIVFLEHLEAGIRYFERTWLTEENFSYYFKEGERLQKKYRGRLSIKLGVEVGFNPLAADILQKKLAHYPWDMIGLSYHFFFDGRQHLNMVSRRRENIEALLAAGADKVIEDYFSSLTEAVALLDCQVLCHLDAVMRHCPGLQFSPSHWEQLDRLLALVKAKKMALEINTSGFALRNEPYPSPPILRKAFRLGIPLTVGSDAHRPDQVGRYFDRLPAYLSRIGQPVDPDTPDNVKSSA